MDDDFELAREFVFGTPGPKGRAYLDPGSERERKARTILARKLREEAPDGYFTQAVAKLIDPPRRSAIFQREIVFKRPRGTPVIRDVRRDVEIAAFMHEQLEEQERRVAATAAWVRNRKRVVHAAHKKFGISYSTIRNIWREFRPKPKGGGRSTNK
jgi:hypothetical protein